MARPIDADVVFDAVCEWFRVSSGDVLGGDKQSGRYKASRRFIARILRDNGYTPTEIGTEMSRGRDSVNTMLKHILPGGDMKEIQKFVKEKCDAFS